MKKIFYFMGIFGLIISFSGCQKNTPEQKDSFMKEEQEVVEVEKGDEANLGEKSEKSFVDTFPNFSGKTVFSDQINFNYSTLSFDKKSLFKLSENVCVLVYAGYDTKARGVITPGMVKIIKTDRKDSLIEKDEVFLDNLRKESPISGARIDDSHFIVVFGDLQTGKLKAFIATIDENLKINIGDFFEFSPSSASVYKNLSIVALSSSSFIVAYQKEDIGKKGVAVFVNIPKEGEISFAEEVVFEDSASSEISLSDLDENNFAISYLAGGSLINSFRNGVVKIGKVNNGKINFGTGFYFNNPNETGVERAKIFSVDKNRLIFLYGARHRELKEGVQIYGRVGIVETDELSFGQEILISENSSFWASHLSENRLFLLDEVRGKFGGLEGGRIFVITAEKENLNSGGHSDMVKISNEMAGSLSVLGIGEKTFMINWVDTGIDAPKGRIIIGSLQD